MIIRTHAISSVALDHASAHRTHYSQAVPVATTRYRIRERGFPPSHLALTRWSCLSPR
jgi:hypothetical protein